MAKDIPCVWSDKRITPVECKRILAVLIEYVTLLKQDSIDIHARFRVVQTQSLNVPCPLPIAKIHKVCPAVFDTLDSLLETHNDVHATEQLNKLYHRNWKGEKLTGKRM